MHTTNIRTRGRRGERRLLAADSRISAMAVLCLGLVAAACADEKPGGPMQVTHQITGLFAPERARDLSRLFEQLPEVKLVSIDFDNAEATFQYDAAQVFPNARPEQLVEQFDHYLRKHSHQTFGAKPRRAIDKEILQRIEVRVYGLDCKACSLAAYEAIYRLKGVEIATASFKEGKVTALIDPEQTDRVEIETALKQRGVELKPPE